MIELKLDVVMNIYGHSKNSMIILKKVILHYLCPKFWINPYTNNGIVKRTVPIIKLGYTIYLFVPLPIFLKSQFLFHPI